MSAWSGSAWITRSDEIVVEPLLERLMGLNGRKALVLSADSDVGWTIAQAFGGAGAKVLLAGRDVDTLESRMQDLQDLGVDARWTLFHGSLPHAWTRLAQETLHRMGEMDVLAFDTKEPGLAQAMLDGADVMNPASSNRWPVVVGWMPSRTRMEPSVGSLNPRAFHPFWAAAWQANGCRFHSLLVADVPLSPSARDAVQSAALWLAGQGAQGLHGLCLDLMPEPLPT